MLWQTIAITKQVQRKTIAELTDEKLCKKKTMRLKRQRVILKTRRNSRSTLSTRMAYEGLGEKSSKDIEKEKMTMNTWYSNSCTSNASLVVSVPEIKCVYVKSQTFRWERANEWVSEWVCMCAMKTFVNFFIYLSLLVLETVSLASLNLY